MKSHAENNKIYRLCDNSRNFPPNIANAFLWHILCKDVLAFARGDILVSSIFIFNELLEVIVLYSRFNVYEYGNSNYSSIFIFIYTLLFVLFILYLVQKTLELVCCSQSNKCWLSCWANAFGTSKISYNCCYFSKLLWYLLFVRLHFKYIQKNNFANLSFTHPGALA